MTSPTIHGKNASSTDCISIFGIEFGSHNPKKLCLWVVAYTPETTQLAAMFWRLTGTGISSRLAERCLRDMQWMRKVETVNQSNMPESSHLVYDTIRQRIASVIERAPVGNRRPAQVSETDVFLYPSGMSAIYHVHHMLLRWHGLESAIVGFPYELTIKMMETYGPSFKFFSRGTDEEIDKFEAYLELKSRTRQAIQAVWCECPCNPLLRTVDLERIRTLANRYGFVVVVDDTIGSFANVDVLGIADIVVTSLTKSFNGFANVLAGRYGT